MSYDFWLKGSAIGERSMFVDAVKQEVAVSSTSLERSSWESLNLLG